MVQEMLEQGIIQYSKVHGLDSPVILVTKRDGTMRFCVSYHRLNSIIKTDVFPLPRIDDSVDILANAKYFSTWT